MNLTFGWECNDTPSLNIVRGTGRFFLHLFAACRIKINKIGRVVCIHSGIKRVDATAENKICLPML